MLRISCHIHGFGSYLWELDSHFAHNAICSSPLADDVFDGFEFTFEDDEETMIQRGDGAGSMLEAFAELFVRGLDGDNAVEPSIARLVDLTHPAGADRREDFVGAGFLPG
jgi:hypothetical protein